MAKSDARFEYKANLSRESHDLSRPFGFTCAPGMLLPVFADYVSAGDYVQIQHDLPFLRTLPLAAPAMIDVKIHFESFFVPAQMIYQPYENVMYSLKNLQSSTYGDPHGGYSVFPTFNYPEYINRFKVAGGSTEWIASEVRADAMRLADMLGLHGENFCEWHNTGVNCPWIQVDYSFFPWQILTYNTIFYYYYALDDKTQFNNKYCNFDYYYSNSFAHSGLDLPIDFMKIHHRPWDFDYFTSAYNSPIVGDNNMNFPLLGSGSYTHLVGKSTTPINYVGNSPQANSEISAFSSVIASVSVNEIKQGISTALIRQMFANEKLAMITGRTKKNFDSQVLAHLGVKVPHDVKHDISLIGHNTYELSVGEVTSLASTENSPLGELAGKGYASSRDDRNRNQDIKHDFKVPTDGFIMTIFSIEPIRRYFGGFEKQNSISNCWDFPHPEFDRLGNEPIYGSEIGGYGVNVNNAYLWKERYYQWKRRSPKASLAYACPQRGQGINDFNSYMLVNRPYSENDSYRLSGTTFSYLSSSCRPSLEERFYIPWNALDHQMLVSYFYGFLSYDKGLSEDWDSNPWMAFQRDPFIVDCYPKVTKVSWMSKDGEPIYNF